MANEVRYRITAEDNTKEATESAAKNNDRMSKSTLKVGEAFSAAAKMVTVAVGAFTLIAGKALQSSAAFEKHQIAFETMLGSASKANKLLKDIEKFSASTPFTMPGLVEGSKRLLAFGTAEEKIIETMKNLGNAAMGNEEVMTRLVDAYGKVQAKGKASMEEINRFTEAGVPLMAELAKNLGKTTAEIIDMTSKGQIGFKEVDQALKSLTTGTGRFAGMIEKQSESLAGLFSTFQDNIGLIFKDIGDALAPMTKEFLSKAIPALQEARKVIAAIFSNLPEFASISMDLVQKIIAKSFTFDVILKNFGAFWGAVVNQAQAAIDFIPKAFGNIIEIVQAPIQAIGEFIMSVFENAFGHVQNFGIRALNVVLTMINNVLGGLDALTFWADNDIGKLDLVKEIDPKPIKDFGNVWDKQMKEAGDNIKLLAKNATDFAGNVAAGWVKAGETVAENFAPEIAEFQAKLSAMVKANEDATKDIGEAIEENITSKWENAIQKSQDMASAYQDRSSGRRTYKDQGQSSSEADARQQAQRGQEFDAAMGGVIEKMGAALMSIESLKIASDPLAYIFQVMAATIEGPLNSALEPLIGIFAVLGETLGTILIPIIQMLAPIIVFIAEAFIFLYNNAIKHFGNGLIGAVKVVSAGFTGIINGIAGAINWLLGFTGINIGYMSDPAAGVGYLRDISMSSLTDRGGAAINNDAGSPAQYSASRNIQVNVNIYTDVIAGPEGVRALALLIRDEIISAEALGQ